MLSLMFCRHTGGPLKDTNMAPPYTELYKFAWIVLANNSRTVYRCNSRTVYRCNSRTVYRCNSRTVYRCNSRTVYRCNSRTVYRCNSRTVYRCNSRTVYRMHRPETFYLFLFNNRFYYLKFLASFIEWFRIFCKVIQLTVLVKQGKG